MKNALFSYNTQQNQLRSSKSDLLPQQCMVKIYQWIFNIHCSFPTKIHNKVWTLSNDEKIHLSRKTVSRSHKYIRIHDQQTAFSIVTGKLRNVQKVLKVKRSPFVQISCYESTLFFIKTMHFFSQCLVSAYGGKWLISLRDAATGH